MGGLTAPPSPCTGVCTLDADDHCIGCGRTIDEIAGWGSMTAAERHAVVALLPMRMRQAGFGISASSMATPRR